MKVFFDTEFSGLKQDTKLLSIGLISENNKKFYAEFPYTKEELDQWIIDNVISNMCYNHTEEFLPRFKESSVAITGSVALKATKETVKSYLNMWFSQFNSVELVSDVCHYDMVLLIDIYGTAFDLPQEICPACYDINQDIARYKNISMAEAFDYSREDLLKELNVEIKGTKHNALYDAKVIKELYLAINK